jgi:hypothetical protein
MRTSLVCSHNQLSKRIGTRGANNRIDGEDGMDGEDRMQDRQDRIRVLKWLYTAM